MNAVLLVLLLIGTPDADRLIGTEYRDEIVALAGDDRIRPNGGRDLIRCGAGYDVVYVEDVEDTYRNCERVRYSPP